VLGKLRASVVIKSCGAAKQKIFLKQQKIFVKKTSRLKFTFSQIVVFVIKFSSFSKKKFIDKKTKV